MKYEVGDGASIDGTAIVGYRYTENIEPAVLGPDATVRAGTIIYGDVIAGARLNTGHGALIREQTELGDDVVVGTGVTIDGMTTIGSNVSLQTSVYIPSETEIGSNVFVGPCTVMTNDPYPLRQDAELVGPTLEEHTSIGANATLLPDVTVGEGAFVAAGALVTEDVPPETLAVGVPAQHEPLPEQLQGENQFA